MTTSNSTRVTSQTQRPNDITPLPMALTQLYDELSEVVALNYFLYDVMEAVLKEPNDGKHHQISHLGLVLFLRYLRERDEQIKDQLLKVKAAAG